MLGLMVEVVEVVGVAIDIAGTWACAAVRVLGRGDVVEEADLAGDLEDALAEAAAATAACQAATTESTRRDTWTGGGRCGCNGEGTEAEGGGGGGGGGCAPKAERVARSLAASDAFDNTTETVEGVLGMEFKPATTMGGVVDDKGAHAVATDMSVSLRTEPDDDENNGAATLALAAAAVKAAPGRARPFESTFAFALCAVASGSRSKAC